MAAHSPYIAQCLSPEALYIGRPGSGVPAGFSGIKGSKAREIPGECRQGGDSLGECIFDLLSGMADDRTILLQYPED